MKSEIGFGIMLLGIALSNGIFAELSGLIVLIGFGKVVLDKKFKNGRFLLKFSHREKAARCCVYMTDSELNFRFRF